MIMSIQGLWVDTPNRLFIAGRHVKLVANFILVSDSHWMEQHQKRGSTAIMANIPGSLVSLYRRGEDNELWMFRWDNGLDMPLEIEDLQQAKNGVEAMLRMEGMNYER
jgi:hypothetical protein